MNPDGWMDRPIDAVPGETMVWMPGGEFLMGSNSHYPEEAPAHRVVGGFWVEGEATPRTTRIGWKIGLPASFAAG